MATPPSRLQRQRNRGGGGGNASGRAGPDERVDPTGNPDYRRTGPKEVDVEQYDKHGKFTGFVRCTNTDCEAILALRDHYVFFKVK